MLLLLAVLLQPFFSASLLDPWLVLLKNQMYGPLLAQISLLHFFCRCRLTEYRGDCPPGQRWTQSRQDRSSQRVGCSAINTPDPPPDILDP